MDTSIPIATMSVKSVNWSSKYFLHFFYSNAFKSKVRMKILHLKNNIYIYIYIYIYIIVRLDNNI